MTLLSPLQTYKDSSAKDTPLNQCENLEEVLSEITGELTQVQWMGIASWLRIDPDKLHLVSTASGCDLQRQKTLGLLCWIEDEPRTATFDRLVAALLQVQASSLAGDVKTFCRILTMRRTSHTRKHLSLQTQYYSMQLGPQSRYPQLPKTALSQGQWKLADMPLPQFLYGSPTVAFYPSRSVPSNASFDLTSSVSIQGSKLNLVHREPWAVRVTKKAARPSTISGKTQQQKKKRSLGAHKRSSQVDISTTIKTAVPLTNNIYRDCHPEEIQDKIANKLFDYLLNGNGSREVLSVVSTLESIEGLVVKKLRRGSIKIETNLHKASALKALWGHFESGHLNEIFQDQLISDNALKMSGAFAISLETSIDRNELESGLQQLQGAPSGGKGLAHSVARRQPGVNTWAPSPIRLKAPYKQTPRFPLTGMQSNPQFRVSSVPASRSVTVELAPSVRTVRPEPRGSIGRGEKPRIPGKSDSVHGVIYDESNDLPDDADDRLAEKELEARDPESQSAPPPTPEFPEDPSGGKLDKQEKNDDLGIKVAMEDLEKRTQEAETAYRQFDETLLRRLVDALKGSSQLGIEKIHHVSDLRKYATILRQNDAADTAKLVEEFVNVTESLDRIHRDVTSKIWLRVAENSSASARSRDSTGSHRRSPLRNQVTQSIEIWQKMLDPKYDFSELESNEEEHLRRILSQQELEEYGGLLSHVPALLATAKTCHQLLNHYLQAP
uniref:Uncharacterized protein LOC100180910 n=1 Tax=Phallusia mammillata TaxID=59560 RepID=A0A6F9DGT6_9ASCI|nr:uncharacterized protein LOC100180910 [Phallusia mammillata]